MQKNYIKFWGVRGSLARPGALTVKFGGNTPCLEIRCGKKLIIIDAGTGIYGLGCEIVRRGDPLWSPNLGGDRTPPLQINLLFTHYHWDHVVGLPFFIPIYDSKNRFDVIGRHGLKKSLQKLLTPPNFPVKLSDFKAKVRLFERKEGKFRIGKVKIEAFDVNHPNGAFGYRFTFPNGKSAVHISDNGPKADDSKLISKIYGADFLIHDAQYLPKEYLKRKKFGHSPYHYALDLARVAKIPQVILFHHDPSRTDAQVAAIERSARKIAKRIGMKAKILAAREGMVIKM